MKKQPEVTEQTRKNILAAFCRLYETRPIERINVKDVIAAAGSHRSTFYAYFSDVYALLAYLEDDVINYIKARAGAAPHTPEALLRLLNDKEMYLKVLLGTFGYVHFQERLQEEFIRKQAAADSGDSLSPYLSEFHMTVSLSMYRLWLKRNKDIPMEELTALIHILYTKGADGIPKMKSL